MARQLCWCALLPPGPGTQDDPEDWLPPPLAPRVRELEAQI